jgi:hypothetical protein
MTSSVPGTSTPPGNVTIDRFAPVAAAQLIDASGLTCRDLHIIENRSQGSENLFGHGAATHGRALPVAVEQRCKQQGNESGEYGLEHSCK